MNRSIIVLALSVSLLAPVRLVLAEQASGGNSAVARQTGAPLNINTATPEQLEELPGIGPRTAVRIVEYRQKNGGFKKLEDLMNIQGIGEKSFLRIKPLITLTPPRENRPAGQ